VKNRQLKEEALSHKGLQKKSGRVNPAQEKTTTAGCNAVHTQKGIGSEKRGEIIAERDIVTAYRLDRNLSSLADRRKPRKGPKVRV